MVRKRLAFPLHIRLGAGAATKLLFCSCSGRLLVAEKNLFVSESSASTASGRICAARDFGLPQGRIFMLGAPGENWAKKKAQGDPRRGRSPARSEYRIEYMFGGVNEWVSWGGGPVGALL